MSTDNANSDITASTSTAINNVIAWSESTAPVLNFEAKLDNSDEDVEEDIWEEDDFLEDKDEEEDDFWEEDKKLPPLKKLKPLNITKKRKQTMYYFDSKNLYLGEDK
jgi:hypothetical protein